ncbi:DNA polymerase III subunit alpha [Anaerolineales bacterium HSG25]|nr:DNA polymerase III subunit alpha [Anaerolineales bacterium HSG25]
MCDFVHLHVHSEYSLLDGLGRTAHLAKEAKRLGQKALALTDHGVMHGAIEFFRNCKKNEVKPIIGVEAYMTPFGRPMNSRDPHKDKVRHHLLLLAQNMTGYKNLLKICSNAQLNGYYYKPRIDADFLAQHSDGLICTTGCMAAEVPWLLNAEDGRTPQPDKAMERLRWYLDVFGRDRFFVELQEHSIPALTDINKTLFDWSKSHNLQLLVTNDVHYVTAEDAAAHDTLLCVQTNSLVSQQKRMRLSDNDYFLKSEEQMRDLFRPLVDLPDSAFTNSVKIADMCNVELEDSSFHLPHLPDQPYELMPRKYQDPEKDYPGYLLYLTQRGLIKRYGEERAASEEVQKRMEHELGIINRMNFAVYFLIVWDMCRFARENNIWWNVRGSGAGSIVAYAVGITLIDPLHNNLIFERFLNPGRVSMPDFDLDYPDDQRELMIKYTLDTYGPERVAQIVAFGRMKARAAIRDVGRALDIHLDEVDRIAKTISAIPGKAVTIDNVLNPEHEFYSDELSDMYSRDAKVTELVNFARNLEGVARHSSIHAAAVIITDKPLVEYVPLMRPTGNATVTQAVTQFEFPVCESIGLLKVDFLGLSTLTVMRKAAELIEDRHGVAYQIENIRVEDPDWKPLDPKLPPNHLKKAFDLLSSGRTNGVFQVEGQGMTNMLREMRPGTFEHIVAAISLYRPGPMEYIPTYIKRMHGEEEVEFKHPRLETILGETYGIIVYQEQIIQIASQLAGYSPGEADMIRKAVGKKIKAKIEEHRSKFVDGSVNNGIDKKAAQSIYDDIEFFARYGFNKAHAADYGMVTCQTAYLKANYPLEYMTALLTVERNNTDKVSMLMGECRLMGIQVLPPHVNYSRIDFVIDDKTEEKPVIRFGMSAIKNVGESAIEAILAVRDESGPFKDIDDFCSRVDLRKVGKRALEGLAKVGAMDHFCDDRGLLLALVDRMISMSGATHKASAAGQMSMFGMVEVDIGSVMDSPPSVKPLERRTILDWEKELVGTYLSEHPVSKNMERLKAANVTMMGDITESMNKRNVRIAGVVVSVRPHRTKKGDPMAFVEIEDMQTKLELVVFPRTYTASSEILEIGNLVIVRGKVDAERGIKILADEMTTELPPVVEAKGDRTLKPRQPNGNGNGNRNGLQTVAEVATSYQTDPAPQASNVQAKRPVELSTFQDVPSIIEETPSTIEETPPEETRPVLKQSPPERRSIQEPPRTDDDTSMLEPPRMLEPPPVNEVPVEPEQSPHHSHSNVEPIPMPDSPLPDLGTLQNVAPVHGDSSTNWPIEAIAEADSEINPPPQVEPVPKEQTTLPVFSEIPSLDNEPPLWLNVRIPYTGDLVDDKHRLKNIFNFLTQSGGKDYFRFHIPSGKKETVIEFPNHRIRYSDRLRKQLVKILSPEAIWTEQR